MFSWLSCFLTLQQNKEQGRSFLFIHLLCSLLAIRYQEAIDKYESVMKTEPNVPHYTNLAKERICFCLVKVRAMIISVYLKLWSRNSSQV